MKVRIAETWKSFNPQQVEVSSCKSHKLKLYSYLNLSCFSLPNPNPNPININNNKISSPSLNLTCQSHTQKSLFLEKHQVTTRSSSNNIISFTDKLVSPLQLLQDDADWTHIHFWSVLDFLIQNSRSQEISKVFDAWTKLEQSRINVFNYMKIIGLLSDAGIMDEATLKLQNMKDYGLQLCPEVFNSIINGYAQKGMFNEALRYLDEMKETNISPDTETYDALIKAYGKFQMYDEMVNCLKMMECSGCAPDHITYNLLICELSKHGLLNRMERMYHTLISKKMNLQSSTLMAMIEAYANFGVLEKMEKLYTKLINSKTFLKEGMIRKIARVYIENYMFSKLDDLGNDVAFKIGETQLFWHLRLLSRACLLSNKGINYVIQEMEEAEFSWTVTVANIILLAYLKMKDFTRLSVILSALPNKHVQPDIVTFGIMYDAHCDGFDWSSTFKSWRKYGYLENGVEVNTDPLVFAAFGKGLFLTTIEEINSLLEPQIRKEKRWTYGSLIDFVLKHHQYRPKSDA